MASLAPLGTVSYTHLDVYKRQGLDRRSAFNQDNTQSVSASVGWTFNDNFSVSLDGMNLTNEKLRYYADNKDQPRGIYQNGRQYYLNFRFKF